MRHPNRVEVAMRAERKAYGYNLLPIPIGDRLFGETRIRFRLHRLGGMGRSAWTSLRASAGPPNTITRQGSLGVGHRLVNILPYLDRGITDLSGPTSPTEVDGRQLVQACYFGPLGERSFGANRGTDYNAGIADKAAYYLEANEQMLVCALLEDAAVLGNLDTILSVPGIDLCSIGPNDFAQSLGYPGQPDHPEVVKTKLSRQCRKSQIVSDRLGARCKRM